MKLAGRVALVPGGAGSMGSAVARLFATEGAAVCVADMDMDKVTDRAADMFQTKCKKTEMF